MVSPFLNLLLCLISRVRSGGAQMGESVIPPAGIPIDIHNVSNIPPTVFLEKCLILSSSDGIFVKQILSGLKVAHIVSIVAGF